MSHTPVYIVSAQRTPIGSFQGVLAPLSAPALGSIAVRAALTSAKVAPDAVDEVFLGNVLSAGIGQAPARQAALGADLPASVPCTTVSKVCGSGMQAVILGARAIMAGDAQLVVAGGMESMSNVPYYLPQARSGYRMGHGQVQDGMIHDGLWDPYNNFHMGNAGELCASKYELTRQAQDEFAAESYQRALAAQASGAFDAEICAVSIAQRKGPALIVAQDEEPGRGIPSKFPTLRPAFTPDGTITAANASSVNDGAAAMVLASAAAVSQYGLTPLAKLDAYASAAQAPEWFTTAPARAMHAALSRASLSVSDMDLFEINEAFACVTMACAKLVDAPLSRVNVHGGAVALGHPIGASGARILTTLVHALRARSARRGLAGICIGGGEALATVVSTL